MILLVTPSDRATECAAALHEATDDTVAVAEDLSRAATLLRTDGYQTVVLDQHLLETEPLELDTTLAHLGTAILVQVNLAVSGMDRLVREVRWALERRQQDRVRAQMSALRTMHSELSGTVTALLLSSDLALQTPNLPATVVERLQSLHEIVTRLRWQLENATATHDVKKPASV